MTVEVKNFASYLALLCTLLGLLIVSGCVRLETEGDVTQKAKWRYCFLCSDLEMENRKDHGKATITLHHDHTHKTGNGSRTEEPVLEKVEAIEVPEVADHLKQFDEGDGCGKETPELCL